MKPHLDIEFGDLVSVVSGKRQGRIGRVIDIKYNRGYRDTLLYTLLDEATQETFNTIGTNLKLLDERYLTQGFEMHLCISGPE